jgi:hypothetical protein
MVDPKVGTVQSQLLGRDGEVDGLVEKVTRGAGLRGWGLRPVTEGQEANLLHESSVGVPDGNTAHGFGKGIRWRWPSAQLMGRVLGEH